MCQCLAIASFHTISVLSTLELSEKKIPGEELRYGQKNELWRLKIVLENKMLDLWTYSCAIRNRIWPPRRDERSRVLIGTGGTWQFDWARAYCTLGHNRRRLLACARAAIDITRMRKTGNLHSAASPPMKLPLTQLSIFVATPCLQYHITSTFWC